MKKNILKIFMCANILLLPALTAHGAAPFCERIVNHEEAVHVDFDLAAKSRMDTQKREGEDLALERQKQDESFVTARLAADDQFIGYLQTLQKKAGKNAEKKAAIDAFENAIMTSRRTFRSAVADIIETFRKSMDSVGAAKRAGFEKAEKTRRTQFDAAIETAKNSCTDGTAPKSTDDTLKTTLRGIRESFRSEQTQVENTARTDHHAAIETRKGTLAKARDMRKKSVEEAVETLRAGWR